MFLHLLVGMYRATEGIPHVKTRSVSGQTCTDAKGNCRGTPGQDLGPAQDTRQGSNPLLTRQRG